MSTPTAKQTPLIELLDRVPIDARIGYKVSQFESQLIPVGTLCAEAAARIRELEAWKKAIIDGLVVAEILTDANESDPKKAMNDLIAWYQDVAVILARG